MLHRRADQGWIEVICGSMFSGKTEELIRRLRRAQIAKQKIQVFKPVIDDRYGIQRVRDMDEMATALILFAEWPRVGPGGLVTLHDSGGERQLMVDLADETGVPLTELGADAVAELENTLDPELPAINPLDAWSRGGPDSADQMADSLAAMMKDPGAAIGAVRTSALMIGDSGFLQLFFGVSNRCNFRPCIDNSWNQQIIDMWLLSSKCLCHKYTFFLRLVC